jgi:polyisoprenoid-binding protein YceI
MAYRRRLAFTICVPLAISLFAVPAFAEILHLRVDPAATQIVATVDEPLARIRGNVSGTFQVIVGEVDGDPANPVATGHVELTLDATTYHSDSEHRDNVVLRDALETRLYPSIKFVSTRIEDLKWEAPDVMATATIVGNLTLHGVTREIRVPIDASISPERQFSADGDIRFDYTDFGIKRPRIFGTLPAGKYVDLNFRVVAVPVNEPAPASAGQ